MNPRQLSTPSPQEAPLAKSTDDKTSAAEEKTAHLPASETAFSKSGLAAFSQKTTSGFGDLGSSSAVFVGRNVFSAQSSGPAGSGKQKLTDSAPVTSISSFVPQKPSAFATTSLSSSLGPSPFSASSFGSAFGIQGIFGGNSDIKNFATSNGDVASGRSKSKLSAFGAPEKEGEEDSNAGSDDEDGGASEPSDQAPTSSTKFQQKEGKSLVSNLCRKFADTTQSTPEKKARTPYTSPAALVCMASPTDSGESVARVSSS